MISIKGRTDLLEGARTIEPLVTQLAAFAARASQRTQPWLEQQQTLPVSFLSSPGRRGRGGRGAALLGIVREDRVREGERHLVVRGEGGEHRMVMPEGGGIDVWRRVEFIGDLERLEADGGGR